MLEQVNWFKGYIYGELEIQTDALLNKEIFF